MIFEFRAVRLSSCRSACSCNHEEVPTGSVLTAAPPSAPGAKAQEPRGLITWAEGAGSLCWALWEDASPLPPGWGYARPVPARRSPRTSGAPWGPRGLPTSRQDEPEDSPGSPRHSAAPPSGSWAPGELGEGPAAPNGARLGGPACATGARAGHHGSGCDPGLRASPLCFTFLVGRPCEGVKRKRDAATAGQAPPGHVSGLPGDCRPPGAEPAPPQGAVGLFPVALRPGCRRGLLGAEDTPFRPQGGPQGAHGGGRGCYPGHRHLPLHKCVFINKGGCFIPSPTTLCGLVSGPEVLWLQQLRRLLADGNVPSS